MAYHQLTHVINVGGKASHTAIVPAAAYSSLVNPAASGERNAVGVGLGKAALLADMVLIGTEDFSIVEIHTAKEVENNRRTLYRIRSARLGPKKCISAG